MPVLTATENINNGDEITIDVGVTYDPKLLSFKSTKLHKKCNCNKANCRGSVESSFSCDLSTIAQQLIGFTPSLKIAKKYYHPSSSAVCLYKVRFGTSPHRTIYAFTRRACQLCKMTSKGTVRKTINIGHCVDCNVHLCNECQFLWHIQVQQEHLTAIDMHGNHYDLKQLGEKDGERRFHLNQMFLKAPVDESLKTLPDELCLQRFDSVHHASLSQQRYGAPCIICGGKAGISRCVKCFVDLCHCCWFIWHPNAEQLCRIVPANCLPLEAPRNQVGGRKMTRKHKVDIRRRKRS